MARLTFSLFLGLTLAVAQIAASQQDDWKQACAHATAAPLKTPALAHVPDEKLQGCDSMGLYYGFDHPPNWTAALQCAYYQRAHPDPSIGNPFYGPGVLTMLYANGRGVRRNYGLAIRFACENTWAAPAEMQGRIEHLEQLRDNGEEAAHFDLCDDATSGLMGGACELVQQRFKDAKRQKELDSIFHSWSPQVQAAFRPLQAAEEAFVTTRTRNEVDLSGTLRAAMQLEEEGLLRDQLLINLRRFARGDIPAASPAEYRHVDRQLNDVYGRIQNSSNSSWEYGTVKTSGIRDTERAWLKLRDAWVEFARVAYPHVSEDTVRTQMTRLRLHQLQSLQPK